MVEPRHEVFQWDRAKAESNRQKHGVQFYTAAEVLSDEEADKYHVTEYDRRHSVHEDRWNTLGAHPANRAAVYVVTWTQRNRKTRIISARKATPKERKDYGERIK